MAALDVHLMPKGLTPDEQIVWWLLGTVARHNADGRYTLITAAALDTYGSDDWARLVDETEDIGPYPLTASQRALLRDRLVEYETEDRYRSTPWWER